MKTWTPTDVCYWFKSLCLNQPSLFDVIKDEKIHGKALAIMTSDDFKEVFGDTLKFGDRKIIMNARDMLLEDKIPHNKTELSYITKTSIVAANNPTLEMLRKFDQDIPLSFKYERGAIARNFDKGLHDLILPIHTFVSIDFQTKHKLQLFDFGDRTIKFICACLNDGTNGTIHFGISPATDEGNKAYEIIGTSLAGEQNVYREFISIAINKCFFPEQRDVVQSCTRKPKFIEVISSDSITDQARFVIEIDVVPSSTLCEDAVFDVRLPNEKKDGKQTTFGKVEIYRFSDGEANVVEGSSQREFRRYKQKLFAYRKEQEGLKESTPPRVCTNLKQKLTRLLCGGEEQFHPDRVFPLLVINSPADHMHQIFIEQNLNFLSRIKFKAVFDFDENATLVKFFHKEGEQTRVIPTIEYFDKWSKVSCGNPEKLKSLHEELKASVQIPWIFVNGHSDSAEESFSPIEWKKTSKAGLQCAVRFFKEEIPAYRAVVVFCLLSKDWKVMLEAAEEFISSFTDQWICIVEDEYIAGPWVEELKRRNCLDDKNVKENMIIGLPWIHVCDTVLSLTCAPDRTTCFIPTSSQGVCTLDKHVQNYMCDLEVLGCNSCDVSELDDMNKKSKAMEEQFYRGAEVDWWNFAFGSHVCKREKFDELKMNVRESLMHNTLGEDNLVGRVVLYHQPGAGGTTLARNVLWDFRKEYRCAVIRNITDVKGTADQIARFRSYKDTDEANPVLLLLDNHDDEKNTQLWATLEREARRIMREKHKRIMCVLLICLRRSIVLDRHTSGTVVLKQDLAPYEKHWFRTHTFSNSDIDPACLISFNIMKENFDKKIISETVKHFVSAITNENELLLLKYISLVNTYDIDFRPIPTAAFDCFMTTHKVSKGTLLFSTSMKRGSGHKYQGWENDLSVNFYTLMNKTHRVGMGYIDSLRITNHFLAACVLESVQNVKKSKQMVSEVAMEFIKCK